MNIKQLSLYLLLTSAIAGCSADPEEKTSEYLEDKQISKALKWLDVSLEDKKNDPLLNGLAAEFLIRSCLEEQCYKDNITKLAPLNNFLRNTKDRVITDNGQRLVFSNIVNIISGSERLTDHPQAIISISKEISAESEIKKRLLGVMLGMAAKHIIAQEAIPAGKLLQFIIGSEGGDLSNVANARLLKSIVANDLVGIKKALSSIRTMSGNVVMPTMVMRALPYAAYLGKIKKDSVNGTDKFIKEFNADVSGYGVTYFLSNTGKKELAASVASMMKNGLFIKDALLHVNLDKSFKSISKFKSKVSSGQGDVTNVLELAVKNNIKSRQEVKPKSSSKKAVNGIATASATVAVIDISTSIKVASKAKYIENYPAGLKLKLLRLSLIVNPKDRSVWKRYTDMVMAYIKQTGDSSVLIGDDIKLDGVDSDLYGRYNDQLALVIKGYIDNNLNVIDFLDKFVIDNDNKAKIKDSISRLLVNAIDKAISLGKFSLIQSYASYDPEIAKFSRQKVVAVTIDTIEGMWAENNFSQMSVLADFLSSDMKINFSLDNLLIKNFEEYLQEMGIQDKLYSNSVDRLLLSKEEVKLDLGQKFIFLNDYFKNSSRLLDDLLKSHIIKAKGGYGSATALYSIYTYFNEDSFPLKERDEYLANAIRGSLKRDTNLSAIEFVDVAYRLYKVHPYIGLSFISEHVVKLVDNMDSSRKIWASISNDLKVDMKNVSPQFVTLMEAVDAYEGGSQEKAADLLALIEEPKYIKLATPYMKEYVDSIKDIQGVYLSELVDDDMHLALIEINPLGGTSEGGRDSKILVASIKFVSAVGTVVTRSQNTLTDNYGKTFSHIFEVKVNPNTLEVIISDKQKSDANLPLGFDKIFGDIDGIYFSKNGDIKVVVGDKSYGFYRVGIKSSKDMYPYGRYGVTEVVSRSKGSVNAKSNAGASILPVGSIIHLKKSDNKNIKPIKDGKTGALIYPVSGELLHPSSKDASLVEGMYNLDTHTVTMQYGYKLKSGAKMEAIIKCNLLVNQLRCAGHNKHWGRSKYSYIVKGLRVK